MMCHRSRLAAVSQHPPHSTGKNVERLDSGRLPAAALTLRGILGGSGSVMATPMMAATLWMCRQEQKEAHPGRGTRRERFQFRTGRPHIDRPHTGHPRIGAAAARTRSAAHSPAAAAGRHTRGARHSPAAAHSLAAEGTAAWPRLQAPAPALTRLTRCATCNCTVSACVKSSAGVARWHMTLVPA